MFFNTSLSRLSSDINVSASCSPLAAALVRSQPTVLLAPTIVRLLVISASLHAIATLICRNRFTTCSATCFFPRAIASSFCSSFCHCSWYKIRPGIPLHPPFRFLCHAELVFARPSGFVAYVLLTMEQAGRERNRALSERASSRIVR